MKSVLACILSSGLMVQVAAASTFLVAPEWRGQPRTTLVDFGFDTDSNPATPNAISNPYGSATATITVSPAGAGWIPTTGSGTLTGFWDLGVDYQGDYGQIQLHIANNPQPLPYKEIWLQIIYDVGPAAAPVISIPGATLLSTDIVGPIESVPPIGAWYLSLTKWRIAPNPQSEDIIIRSDPTLGSMIDRIVVDTVCVPEPVSILLAALGTLTWFGRRRRMS